MSGANLRGTEILRFVPLPPIMPNEDLAEEYAIQAIPTANSGFVVYAKYHGEWVANPFCERPVVRYLLHLLDETRKEVAQCK